MNACVYPSPSFSILFPIRFSINILKFHNILKDTFNTIEYCCQIKNYINRKKICRTGLIIKFIYDISIVDGGGAIKHER